MSPLGELKELYWDDLWQIVQVCAEHGFAHVTKDVCLLGYYTHSSCIEIKSKKVLDKADTIFVYAMAGNMKKAFDFVEPKKFIAYERFDGNFRLHSFERMRRLCDG